VAGRRARPPVTARAEIVASLDRRGLSLTKPSGAGVKPPAEPVGEGPRRGVGVVDNQRQRARAFRHVRPSQRRREILPLTGIPPRNRLAVFEDAAQKHKLRHPQQNERTATRAPWDRLLGSGRRTQSAIGILCLESHSYTTPSASVGVSDPRRAASSRDTAEVHRAEVGQQARRCTPVSNWSSADRWQRGAPDVGFVDEEDGCGRKHQWSERIERSASAAADAPSA
jgi:hypothetical protein